ncbi:MAG: acyl-CoA synthetase FdrA [Alphaproteobacteria bacterium]
MSVILNEVRRATYLDSIVLMRISRQIAALPGVEEAGLIIGTPANKEILRDANILGPEGSAADPGDLIIALRTSDVRTAEAALAEAKRLLDQPSALGTTAAIESSRTVRAAIQRLPEANLALISVPGDFAVAEARKAMELGLHVMIFSDNVPIADEATLKRTARDRGLFVMGPDCGTAIIGGVPLGFANVVPTGDIGIIGASGTGIQEVSCLIARAGRGISHAIGTGGRDLKAEVGAITTLMAIDALDADDRTKHVVLISKPPAASVARAVLERVAKSSKPFTICFLGATDFALPANARSAGTLKATAELVVGGIGAVPANPRLLQSNGRKRVRGLFAGGTLCSEAQIIFRQAGLPVMSNVPVPGASPVTGTYDGHVLIDLGDDEFTRGRPHPMFEPGVRDAPLAEAIADPNVGVVLLDVVLGYGGHPDPAGHLVARLANRDGRPVIVASVTGTDADPQPRETQIQKLVDAEVIVAGSNADAAEAAIAALSAH